MPNRRNFIRYVIEAKISFKTKADVSKIIQGRVLDISTIGWGAFFKENIDVNTVIDFDLAANFFEPHLTGTGKIINVTQYQDPSGNGFRIGTEFIEVDKELVLRFISESQRLLNVQRKNIATEKNPGWDSAELGPY